MKTYGVPYENHKTVTIRSGLKSESTRLIMPHWIIEITKTRQAPTSTERSRNLTSSQETFWSKKGAQMWLPARVFAARILILLDNQETAAGTWSSQLGWHCEMRPVQTSTTRIPSMAVCTTHGAPSTLRDSHRCYRFHAPEVHCLIDEYSSCPKSRSCSGKTEMAMHKEQKSCRTTLRISPMGLMECYSRRLQSLCYQWWRAVWCQTIP